MFCDVISKGGSLFIMALALLHRGSWKQAFDFLSEPGSFCLYGENHELWLVVYLKKEEIFLKKILKYAWRFYLDGKADTFRCIDELLDYYIKHPDLLSSDHKVELKKTCLRICSNFSFFSFYGSQNKSKAILS